MTKIKNNSTASKTKNKTNNRRKTNTKSKPKNQSNKPNLLEKSDLVDDEVSASDHENEVKCESNEPNNDNSELEEPPRKRRRLSSRAPPGQVYVQVVVSDDVTKIAPEFSKSIYETTGVVEFKNKKEIRSKGIEIIDGVIANSSGEIMVSFNKDLEMNYRQLEIGRGIVIRWDQNKLTKERQPEWNLGSIRYTLQAPTLTLINEKNDINIRELNLIEIGQIPKVEEGIKVDLLGYICNKEPSTYGFKLSLCDTSGIWTYMFNGKEDELPTNNVLLMKNCVIKDKYKNNKLYRNIISGYWVSQIMIDIYYHDVVEDFLKKKDDFVLTFDSQKKKFEKSEFVEITLNKLLNKIKYVLTNQLEIKKVYFNIVLKCVKVVRVVNPNSMWYYSLKTDSKNSAISEKDLDGYEDEEIKINYKINAEVEQQDTLDPKKYHILDLWFFGAMATTIMGIEAPQLDEQDDQYIKNLLANIGNGLYNIYINNYHENYGNKLYLKQRIVHIEKVIKEEGESNNNNDDDSKDKNKEKAGVKESGGEKDAENTK